MAMLQLLQPCLLRRVNKRAIFEKIPDNAYLFHIFIPPIEVFDEMSFSFEACVVHIGK